jgi:nucleoside-diphosphate-sugar epimerase
VLSAAGLPLMRVFLAGASGVIGLRLVPLLVAAGHEVAGMTRSPEKVEALRDLGAEPVVCNVFDAEALRAVVVAFQPEVVLNELTDLPDKLAARNEANARMRREGTRNLLAAAEAAGASRFIAQSVAWQLSGGPQIRTALRAGHVLRNRKAPAAARARRRGRPPHRHRP